MRDTLTGINAEGGLVLSDLDQSLDSEALQLILGATCNALLITDALDRVIYVNSGFTRMLGLAAADVMGLPILRIFGERNVSVGEKYRQRVRRGEAFQSEEIVYGKNGKRLWSLVTANPVFNRRGEHAVTICVLTDITDTKMREVLQNRAVDAMARDVSSAEVLELICREVEAIIPEAVVAVNGIDENNRLFPIACPSLPENCRASIRGLSAVDEHSPSWRAATLGESVCVEDLAASALGRERMQAFLDIGVQSCWATPITAPDGRRLGTVTYYYFDKRRPDAFQERLSEVLVNLCVLALERMKIREKMRLLTFYDPLTGLPNRDLLLANGDRMLHDNRQSGREVPTAVFCLNIDRFRLVNASLGYYAGNELLRVIAERLAGKRYAGDLVGRVGADEFALVLPGCDEAKAAALAARLLASIDSPCQVAGVEITPTASIGIALYPENAHGMEALLNAANAALAVAKKEGDGQYAFFSEEGNVRARRNLSLESRLRSAVDNHELRLFYQPQMRFDSGLLHGVEALARWENREFGSVSPESFIPIAEEAGLIDGISDWVLGEVCRQLGDWRRRGVPVPSVAVNLSTPNFHDRAFPGRIWAYLARNGLAVSDLVIEITENVFIDDNPATMAAIREVRDMGFRLSLDDFGTGYSGLGYLRDIPITEIKMDRSFVRDLESEPSSRRLSQAIMRLGENLGLRVVVEGVETAEQFALLKTQGFHILQGYYISRPMTPETLEQWLRDYDGRERTGF